MELSPDAPYREPIPGDLKSALLKRRDMRPFSRIEGLLVAFSPSERLLLYILSAAFAMSAFVLLADVNAKASVLVPSQGGTLTEGVVGSARFINPLLALSEADRDLTHLIYSGLTRAIPDGSIIPDLAESYNVSEDGTTYTFTLRPNLTFHDGSPLTSSDILFTIHAAQNQDIRSPRRADWEGVTVSAPDERTVIFELPRPYAPFLENTTLGILPEHIWENTSSEEFSFAPSNIRPVGSGPYRFESLQTDSSGAPQRYTLRPFKQFALGEPYVRKITFTFFANESALVDAWNAGRIESFAGISPAELLRLQGDNFNIMRAPLPRIFGVFFNQGAAPVLADDSVRAALNAAVNKEEIIQTVLGGYGTALDGPIPPGVLSGVVNSEDGAWNGVEEARAILERGGWTYDEEAESWFDEEVELAFTLATADSPELVATAESLVATWQEAGMRVSLHVYPLSELNANVIRPRSYDAILFGEVVGRTIDLFAFWHSSQRNDPGLNLALYTNARADTLLANARATTNRREREDLYESFAEILREEQPAIFLYAPQLIYVLPENIHGVELGSLAIPGERFSNVHEWHVETERVWSVFAN